MGHRINVGGLGMNYALIEEINSQRRQLQQEKEEYEKCYHEYKGDMENEYNEFYGRVQALAYQDSEIYETKDTKLLNIIEDNRESLNKAGEICGKLLMTVDEDFKNYLYTYEIKDDELQRELNRLELM